MPWLYIGRATEQKEISTAEGAGKDTCIVVKVVTRKNFICFDSMQTKRHLFTFRTFDETYLKLHWSSARS